MNYSNKVMREKKRVSSLRESFLAVNLTKKIIMAVGNNQASDTIK